jgi:hypothetical protein
MLCNIQPFLAAPLVTTILANIFSKEIPSLPILPPRCSAGMQLPLGAYCRRTQSSGLAKLRKKSLAVSFQFFFEQLEGPVPINSPTSKDSPHSATTNARQQSMDCYCGLAEDCAATEFAA